MENELLKLFSEVERHASALVRGEAGTVLSEEEERVLALQAINRLNQRIGFLVRGSSNQMGDLRLLQTYVNNLTLGVKSNSFQRMRAAMASIRNIISTIENSKT